MPLLRERAALLALNALDAGETVSIATVGGGSTVLVQDTDSERDVRIAARNIECQHSGFEGATAAFLLRHLKTRKAVFVTDTMPAATALLDMQAVCPTVVDSLEDIQPLLCDEAIEYDRSQTYFEL
jgi:hypothetical protein